MKNLKDVKAQLLANPAVRQARLYDGQATNFRSDGGGFTPLFVTPT